ncbi:STM4013/SEN3800 family hydrolase [Flammeovirga sp. OC4]|uniref:STM4013/SEN3800 family hydrolase n=1 Tax=Flammeovirga sp. OC4 TaxID=1382345 RepID=UPI0005C4AF18|nr:STM4013/SEN3800 family hydrolase [Flammeovirga sp. OC4]
MINANKIVGDYDIVLITLDTLRYDVSQQLFKEKRLPQLQKYLPESGWEKRHAPGSFTYASHHAIFSGFFPTPIDQPKQERLFATQFAGSETTNTNTFTFEQATIIDGLKAKGYHTACIGGVGFFNRRSALSKVFPSMFDESHWEDRLGVTSPFSTKYQFQKAEEIVQQNQQNRLFLFINISAIHQPNYFYQQGAKEDSITTHAKALEYVDSQWEILMNAFKGRPTLFLLMGDHGTAYGEDGYNGHRLAHEVVWNVPYAEFLMNEK